MNGSSSMSSQEPRSSRSKVVVVGGCGHVGLPLSIALASHFDVHIYDINPAAVAMVREGKMPFEEVGAHEALPKALKQGMQVSCEPQAIVEANYIILIIGTPVDKHLNPDFELFEHTLKQLSPFLRSGQTLVLRSTVYPGTTEKVADTLRRRGLDIEVAFCPERVAEGKALEEICSLPQLVSAFSEKGLDAARALFRPLGCEIVELTPLEAELAKLFTNAWRYITFAVANQFYMIASDYELDYARILRAMKHRYPRAEMIPGPGFAAGPCLFKDTMQLSAFGNNQFFLGHAAMLVNEGMPKYVVTQMKRACPDLRERVVGILGMAFKPGSDDPRESLSYKLKKILRVEAREVLTTDPLVADSTLVPLEEVIERADILVMGVPHREYATIDLKGKPLFDLWQSGFGASKAILGSKNTL